MRKKYDIVQGLGARTTSDIKTKLDEYHLYILKELEKGSKQAVHLEEDAIKHMARSTFHKKRKELIDWDVIKRRVRDDFYPSRSYYELVTSAPTKRVIAGGYTLKNFPEPFVRNGRPDLVFVLGYSRWDEKELDERKLIRPSLSDAGACVLITQILSRFILEGYKEKIEIWLDTWDKEDLKLHNLIVIGSPRVNLIARELNECDNFWFKYIVPVNPSLAAHYGGRPILDPITRKLHQWEEPDKLGLLSFGKSPYNEKKHVLLVFGHSSAGTLASAYALTDIHEIRERPYGGVVRGRIYSKGKGFKVEGTQWITKRYNAEEFNQAILWARSAYSKYKERYPALAEE